MLRMWILFIVAFSIRLISLDQSLWLDEATTANVVRSYDFSQIITLFSRFDFHPPFYYFFMKAWSTMFGTSEVALRMPSVIFSLLGGYMVYLIGRKLRSENIGFWAAVFFLFNPLIMYYSQEARMYTMATFFLSAAFYFYLKLDEAKKIPWREVVLVNVFFFVSFVTFYGSIFFISAMFIWLLYKRKYKLFFLIHPGLWIALLMLSPLLYLQLLNAKKTLQLVTNWSQVLGTVSIKNLLLFPLKFSVGRIDFYPKIMYYGVAGAWSIAVFSFAVVGAMRNRKLVYFIAYVIGTGLLFSYFSPLLQYFRFQYLLIPFSLLLALGATHKISRIVLLTGFVGFSLAYLLLPQFHRENWKGLVSKLPKNQPIYMIGSFADPLKYYGSARVQDIRELEISVPTARTITVIPYGEMIHGVRHEMLLNKKAYRKTGTISVKGITAETWVRN